MNEYLIETPKDTYTVKLGDGGCTVYDGDGDVYFHLGWNATDEQASEIIVLTERFYKTGEFIGRKSKARDIRKALDLEVIE